MSRMVEELMDAGVPSDQIERLLLQWGGLPLYVPREARADHVIARIAGLPCMAALVAGWGGLRVTLPLGRALARERQRRQVMELRAAGLSLPDIARRLHLHLRQAQRLASEGARAAEAHGDRAALAARRQMALDLG